MRKISVVLVCLCLCSVGKAARANHDQALHFDGSYAVQGGVRCDLRHQAVPEINDFDLLGYALMRSRNGNRVALVTVRNEAGGQRIFADKDVVALLANCRTVRPREFSKALDAGESYSTDVFFGYQEYPIIKLLVKRQPVDQ